MRLTAQTKCLRHSWHSANVIFHPLSLPTPPHWRSSLPAGGQARGVEGQQSLLGAPSRASTGNLGIGIYQGSCRDSGMLGPRAGTFLGTCWNLCGGTPRTPGHRLRYHERSTVGCLEQRGHTGTFLTVTRVFLAFPTLRAGGLKGSPLERYQSTVRIGAAGDTLEGYWETLWGVTGSRSTHLGIRGYSGTRCPLGPSGDHQGLPAGHSGLPLRAHPQLLFS